MDQDVVDAIWKKEWDQEIDPDHSKVFSNQLFVEAYPIFENYLPKKSFHFISLM